MTDTCPTLNLHLGAHKTATSFTQLWLSANAEALARQAVHYIPPKDIRNEFNPRLHPNVGTANPPAEVQQDRAEARRWLHERVAASELPVCMVLISEETLISSASRKLIKADLGLRAQRRLQVLRKCFEGWPVKLFFALRDQGSWASSLFADTVAGPREDLFDPDAVRQIWLEKRPSWLPVVKAMAEVFPDAPITVWRYEDFRPMRDRIMQRLCDGADLAEPPPSTPVRASLPAAGIAHLLAIQDQEGSRARKRAVKTAREDFARSADSPAFTLWTKDEAKLFAQDYAEDLKAIGKLGPRVELLKPPRRWGLRTR